MRKHVRHDGVIAPELLASDDTYECTIRSYPTEVRRQPPRVTIGDVTYEFPEGTTDEEAQSVLDEAKARYLKLKAAP